MIHFFSLRFMKKVLQFLFNWLNRIKSSIKVFEDTRQGHMTGLFNSIILSKSSTKCFDISSFMGTLNPLIQQLSEDFYFKGRLKLYIYYIHIVSGSNHC